MWTPFRCLKPLHRTCLLVQNSVIAPTRQPLPNRKSGRQRRIHQVILPLECRKTVSWKGPSCGLDVSKNRDWSPQISQKIICEELHLSLIYDFLGNPRLVP